MGKFRMAHTASTQPMALQVHDTEGHTYSVLIRVDEKAAQGTLMITGSAAGAIQQYSLTQLQKSCNGKTLKFKSSGATVTLTIEEAHTPDVQPTVYCTIDDMGPGIFGVRGKAIAAIDPDQDRLREVMQA